MAACPTAPRLGEPTFADSTWATNLTEYCAELAIDFMVAHETVYEERHGPDAPLSTGKDFDAHELEALLRRTFEAGQKRRDEIAEVDLQLRARNAEGVLRFTLKDLDAAKTRIELLEAVIRSSS